MWEVPGNCNEVMSLLQMSSDHFWEERRIVISEVCHHLNKTQKEFCLKKKRISPNALKKKQNELCKVNVQLRKDYRKSWEKTEMALYETNQQLESQTLELHQTNQWADRAQKRIWRFQYEKQNQPRTSRKRLPRNGWIKKNFLWASGWSQTFQNWWTLHAEERESLHRESTFVPNSGIAAQHELFEWRKRFSWSWESKQLWNVAHSQSTQENSGSQKNDQLWFGFAEKNSKFCR